MRICRQPESGIRPERRGKNGVTRDVVFKMERPGLVEVGQTVEVTESVTPFNVNYMIEPAVANVGAFSS